MENVKKISKKMIILIIVIVNSFITCLDNGRYIASSEN